MRRRFILYVHEQSPDRSGLDLLMEKITDHHIIEVVIDINDYDASKAEIEEALREYIPDVIISEGLAAFFVHPLTGYDRVCINAEIYPSLRCEKSLVKMYRDIERTQLAYDRSQDFDEGTHCWGIFGIDVERREFAMLYYPNITTIPRPVKTVVDAIDECVAIVKMIGESNYVDDNGVHFAEYGRVLTKVDHALFRGVKEYTVPDSVVIIADGAFFGSNIERINIAESVTYIGKFAFRDCQCLKEVVLPSRVSTIQTGCFLFCSSLKSVVLPKSLTAISTKAFWQNDIKEIELPDTITRIEPKSFDAEVKFIVGSSKFTEVLQQAYDYNLSQIEDD